MPAVTVGNCTVISRVLRLLSTAPGRKAEGTFDHFQRRREESLLAPLHQSRQLQPAVFSQLDHAAISQAQEQA
jgi:hypothetical protein